MGQCPNCGKPTNPELTTCTNCGAPTGTVTPPPPSAESREAAATRPPPTDMEPGNTHGHCFSQSFSPVSARTAISLRFCSVHS